MLPSSAEWSGTGVELVSASSLSKSPPPREGGAEAGAGATAGAGAGAGLVEKGDAKADPWNEDGCCPVGLGESVGVR